jgi:hypothetical protein
MTNTVTTLSRKPTNKKPVLVKYVGDSSRDYWSILHAVELLEKPVECFWTDGWDFAVRLTNSTQLTLFSGLFEEVVV